MRKNQTALWDRYPSCEHNKERTFCGVSEQGNDQGRRGGGDLISRHNHCHRRCCRRDYEQIKKGGSFSWGGDRGHMQGTGKSARPKIVQSRRCTYHNIMYLTSSPRHISFHAFFPSHLDSPLLVLRVRGSHNGEKDRKKR